MFWNHKALQKKLSFQDVLKLLHFIPGKKRKGAELCAPAWSGLVLMACLSNSSVNLQWVVLGFAPQGTEETQQKPLMRPITPHPKLQIGLCWLWSYFFTARVCKEFLHPSRCYFIRTDDETEWMWLHLLLHKRKIRRLFKVHCKAICSKNKRLF